MPEYKIKISRVEIDVSLQEENHGINFWKKMVQLRTKSGIVGCCKRRSLSNTATSILDQNFIY